MTKARAILCPYCAERQPEALQCRACAGRFDVWSLLATQNDMGVWFVRDSQRPHFVGFRFESLAAAIRAGEVGPNAIVRGPTTRQFWTIARRVPGLAHLFARCHRCQSPVVETDPICSACGNAPSEVRDHNFVGLPPFEPVAAPRDAKADLSAFLEDSGILLVALPPVRPPGQPLVRVAQPAMPSATESASPRDGHSAGPAREAGSAVAFADAAQPPSSRRGSREQPRDQPPEIQLEIQLESQLESQLGRSSSPGLLSSPAELPVPAPRPDARAVPSTPFARSAFSPIDRSLVERARRLEQLNRVLVAATSIAVVVCVVLIFAYASQRDGHAKDVAAARVAGAAEVRAEFVRTQPVVASPPAELPPMPADPARPAPKDAQGAPKATSAPAEASPGSGTR